MATFQDKYRNTILKAKNYVGCLAGKLVQRELYGDDISCAETKMLLLVNLIETAEIHYCFNFDDNGEVAEPEYDCMDYDEANKLISNINLLMK